MSNKANKVFEVTDKEVNRILFGDDSDDEEQLLLDDEDLEFLENDLDYVESNDNVDKIEVVIEPPAGDDMNTEKPNDLQKAFSSSVSTPAQEEPSFYWTKILPQSSTIDFSNHNAHDSSYEFGKILIEKTDNPTAYEVFEEVTHFNDFLKHIAIPQIELYSQQKGTIFSTNLEEIRALFGMHVVMGYHVLPSFRGYWSTEPDLGVPYISNIMPLRRFEILRSFLHFNNNELMRPRANPDHDRLFKVRPVLGHFNKSFLAAMNPTKHQSIDEHMLKFKGHNVLRQYVKGKPIQWGFKMWCKCDSRTGYLFEFDVYAGKKTNQVQFGLGEGVVLQLTEKLKDLFCEIYIDNFFNSPILQHMLALNGVLSAGTVRSSRKHLPKDDVPADKEMDRGEVACYESNGIYYVKWKDNKGVHMLSNHLSAYPLQKVQRRKKGSKDKDDVPCPNVIKLYNYHMGGVDLMDQKKGTYQFDHRSKIKYYLCIIFDLVDIAINNSFIVYTKLCIKNAELPTMDSKTFRRTIARTLIGNFSSRNRSIPSSSIATSSRRSKYGKACGPKHTIEKAGVRKRCKWCTSKKVQNRTDNKCAECGAHLCFGKGRDCFKAYHDEFPNL